MSYAHIIAACAGETWALQREKLEALVAFLALKERGGDADMAFVAPPPPAMPGRGPGDGGTIAILPVYGVLAQRMNMLTNISGGTSMQMLGAAFRDARADPNVKAIVLEFDSAGGTVAGTQELADQVVAARGDKPIVAHINSLSASAAYWLASAADEIVVTPGGQAGSIGVYRLFQDVRGSLDQQGIRPEIFRGGENKLRDSGLEPLTDRARERIQSDVDQAYDRMVTSIAANRGISAATVRERYGAGDMFGAGDLLSRGMVDRIATYEATLESLGASPFNPTMNANLAARTEQRRADAEAAVQRMRMDLAGVGGRLARR
jgi:signal peptide peptidase SppA